MNKVILTNARLTADPELRYSADGQLSIALFSLAVDRDRTKADGTRDTDFIQCKSFGKTAENAEKYLHRGSKVNVEGRWETGSYEKDGKRFYTNMCVIDRYEFAESKAEADARMNGSQRQAAAPARETVPAAGAAGADNFMNIPEGAEEDLPFNQV